MALELHTRSGLMEVYFYPRQNGKSPAKDYWNSCDVKHRKKFQGSFDALGAMGADYVNRERFIGLTDEGKPMWEFKEFDHRFYCSRELSGKSVRIVLLSGYVKDKSKDKRERIEIAKAKTLLTEYLQEKA